MKVKKGMKFQSKTDPRVVIMITSKYNGNGHWNSTKVNDGSSNKNHRVHETTLAKYYDAIA